MKSYEDLEDENAVLRDRLAAIVSPDLSQRLRSIMILSPKESIVLALLYQREACRKEAIYIACFERDNGDGPCHKIVDVYICKLRARLREAKVPGRIETQWGQGYCMDPLMRGWLDERVGDAAGSPTAHWVNTFQTASPASLRAALAVLSGLIPEPDTFRNLADRQEALGIAA